MATKTYRGWTQIDCQDRHWNADQMEDGTLDDRRRDGGTNSTLRIQEQELGRLKKRWRDQLHFEDSGTGTQLTLNEHNDVDDDEVSDTKHKCCQFTWSLKYTKFQITD